MTKQEAKQQIAKLIEKYQRLVDTRKVKSYNEAQTRNEFIEPLFEFLGWDMRNLENPSEVTTEETVSKGRVDLAFRLNHIPVMFLEAKAMKVDLDEWKWAEQAINYSWNKSVTWAILSDFEGIKVFNAEIPPKSLSQNLFFELKWHEYLDCFDQLWLLSKESFEEKKLAEQAEKWGKLTKRKQVGEKLFEDLTTWRALLTKDFKKNNSNIDEDALDEGVQKVLDRLIFIRTAEDRKIEQNILLSLVREWESAGKKHNIFKRLNDGFRWFDDHYNSKLFASHALENWKADDKVFETIIKGLYQTTDGYRYDFSAISTDVLGGIYEQYLGYVQEKAQKDDKKKSKRKSQGIYYTPKYVVEYLIEQTLGEVLKKAKAKDIPNIKILDPACGSGSFLISAYDKMLEAKTKLEKQTGLFDRFEILKNNIYGVDLDEQAIEIAQLNLLLRVLSQRTKLPTLSYNIRIGNSLVESETEKLQEIFGDKWREQKAFNWKQEFSEVFEQGGFDVIIGNPPYIKEYTNKSAFNGLHDNPYYQGKMDIWTLFACRAIDLLKDGGYFSFIAPNNWLTNAGASIFRNKILSEGEIVKFIDFGDFKVFDSAGIQTMIFIFKKGKVRKNYKTDYAKIIDKNIETEKVEIFLRSNLKKTGKEIVSFKAKINPENLIGENLVFSNEEDEALLNKIESKKNFELGEKEVAQGIVAAPDKYYIVNDLSNFQNKELEFLKPFYTSASKYAFSKTNSYIFYLCDKNFRDEKIDNYPNIKNHFEPFKTILKEAKIKYGTPEKPYFYLHREREEKFFQKGPKVVGQTRTAFPSFLYTEDEYYGSRAMNFIKTNRIELKYLTALLNSKVAWFWLKNKGKQLGDLLQIDKGPLLNIPLVKPSEKEQAEVAKLAELMINLQKEAREMTDNTDKHARLKTEIVKLDEKIDRAIYKLYDLTDEEIGVIERIG